MKNRIQFRSLKIVIKNIIIENWTRQGVACGPIVSLGFHAYL